MGRASDGDGRRLRRRQALTVALLMIGYTGYYLCRSDYAVCKPLILQELTAQGMDPDAALYRLGVIDSFGMAGYAAGKFSVGWVADVLGGRFNFLAGMVGSVGSTLLFASGGALSLWTIAWTANRLFQSFGWTGMIKITSRWFGHASYGRVVGLLSLSFLFGDAAARTILGSLIDAGLGWRGVFAVSAAGLLALFALCAWLVRESPGDLGLEEPPADPANLYGDQGTRADADSGPAAAGPWGLLGPLVSSRGFWLVCGLSVGLTLMRETFNAWTPTYFTLSLGLSPSAAARSSALFPLAGGMAVLAFGWLSDRLGAGGRSLLMAGSLALAGGVMAVLALSDLSASPRLPIALVTLVAFLLIGPYSLPAGVFALDFGGKRGGGTAAGIIDGLGYLGGILAGERIAAIVVAHGWSGAFTTLAVIAALTSLLAIALAFERRHAARPAG